MFLPMPSAVIAAVQPSTPAKFEIVGGGIVSGEAVQATWQQVPTAGRLHSVAWSQLPHEAIFNAACKSEPDGTLRGCRIYRTLPARLTESKLGDQLFQQLRLSRESAAKLTGNSIFVFIRMINPAGTDKNISYCEGPFCSVTPPPPPVAPVPSERG